MTELTTMNLFADDMKRLDKLRLSHSAEKGEHMTWPEYVSHIAQVMGHVGKCDRCRTVLLSCIQKRK